MGQYGACGDPKEMLRRIQAVKKTREVQEDRAQVWKIYNSGYITQDEYERLMQKISTRDERDSECYQPSLF